MILPTDSVGSAPSPGSPPRRGHYFILAGILAFALAMKLIHLSLVHHHPLLMPEGQMDPKYYLDFALRVTQGDLLAGNEVFFISPFYIYFLAAIFGLFGSRLLAAYLVQSLLGVLAVGLTYLVGRRVFGIRAGLFAAALAGLDGILTFYEVTLLPESVSPFLTALLLWLLVRHQDRPGARSGLGIGIVLGLLCLDRPNALLLVPVAGWFVLFSSRPLRTFAWRPAAAFVLGISLTILPVTWRNYLVGHDLVLISSHGGMNFYIGNGPGAIGTYQAPAGVSADLTGQMNDTRRIAEAALGRSLKPSEVSSYYYRLAWEQIRAHPGPWLSLVWRKFLYVVNGVEVGLNLSYSFFRDEVSWPLRVLGFGFGWIFPLGLVGLGLARKQPVAILAAFAGVYALSLVLFFVADRYRIPLHLPLLLFAGFALDRWLGLVQRRSWLSAITLAGTAFCIGWLSNLDQGLQQDKDLMRTELILYHLEHGQIDAARQELARLSPLAEQSPIINLRLGQAFLMQNQSKEALTYLQAAARLDPKDPLAHQLLAMFYLQHKDHARALPHLQAWFWQKPEDLQAGLALASAYSQLGQAPAAISLLRGLKDIRPREAYLHYFLGVLLAAEGAPEEARQELEQAAALEPENSTYQQALLQTRGASAPQKIK